MNLQIFEETTSSHINVAKHDVSISRYDLLTFKEGNIHERVKSWSRPTDSQIFRVLSKAKKDVHLKVLFKVGDSHEIHQTTLGIYTYTLPTVGEVYKTFIDNVRYELMFVTMIKTEFMFDVMNKPIDKVLFTLSDTLQLVKNS